MLDSDSTNRFCEDQTLTRPASTGWKKAVFGGGSRKLRVNVFLVMDLHISPEFI